MFVCKGKGYLRHGLTCHRGQQLIDRMDDAHVQPLVGLRQLRTRSGLKSDSLLSPPTPKSAQHFSNILMCGTTM